YCRTSHAAQGKDKPVVLIAQSAMSAGASSLEQAYVSVSRASEKALIFTDDRAQLRRMIEKSGARHSASALVRAAAQESREIAPEPVTLRARIGRVMRYLEPRRVAQRVADRLRRNGRERDE